MTFLTGADNLLIWKLPVMKTFCYENFLFFLFVCFLFSPFPLPSYQENLSRLFSALLPLPSSNPLWVGGGGVEEYAKYLK